MRHWGVTIVSKIMRITKKSKWMEKRWMSSKMDKKEMMKMNMGKERKRWRKRR